MDVKKHLPRAHAPLGSGRKKTLDSVLAKLRRSPLPPGKAPAPSPLSLRFLTTPAERLVIADLRKYSASAVEDDLGLELGPAESQRDEAGMVAAISNGLRVIATIRFVPSGRGLTGAERLKDGVGPDTRFLGPGGWEVGRLIVAPEDRDPALLSRCLALALTELVRLKEVHHFYAIATPSMARLWRRFGMRIATLTCGSSGTPYTLVCGTVADVARALGASSPRATRVRAALTTSA
jgi:hypothetical protein